MKSLLVVVGLVAIVAVGCASSGADVAIEDAWARTSTNVQNAGAAYMTIGGGDAADRLVGVSVDASVAAMAELHESSMTESEDGTSMMTMQAVPSIAVPAGGEVVLEPGGYHVMLMQLATPLVAGDEFTVTLTFETAGDKDVIVEVRDS